jgi:hypothetical protein
MVMWTKQPHGRMIFECQWSPWRFILMRELSAFQVQWDIISSMDAEWIQMTGHLFRKNDTSCDIKPSSSNRDDWNWYLLWRVISIDITAFHKVTTFNDEQ